MMAAESVFVDKNHCIRTDRSIVITYTTSPPTDEYLRAWVRVVDDLTKSADNIAVLTVISGAASAPSDEAKRRIAEVLDRRKKSICGLAYVVEGKGFQAAAMRSALSLICLVGRYPFPQKTFASSSEAASWLLERQGRAGTNLATVSQMLVSMRTEVENLRTAKAG